MESFDKREQVALRLGASGIAAVMHELSFVALRKVIPDPLQLLVAEPNYSMFIADQARSVILR